MTAVAIEPVTRLDEDWAVPCERKTRLNAPTHCGGKNPAEWVLWILCNCAPSHVLYCSVCMGLVLSAPLLQCPTCHLMGTPKQVYYRIEPLNRRES